MLRFLKISRILTWITVLAAMLPLTVCARANAGCGDYLHTRLGPPTLSRLTMPLLPAHTAIEFVPVGQRGQTGAAPTATSADQYSQHSPPISVPGRLCLNGECRQSGTPLLPLPRPFLARPASVQAVLLRIGQTDASVVPQRLAQHNTTAAASGGYPLQIEYPPEAMAQFS
jgi:hypothetical protein